MSRPPVPGGPYLVVGAARAGVAAARALAARHGPGAVAVADAGNPVATREATRALEAGGGRVLRRDDGLALLPAAGCVVKSPGVPMDARVLAAARARGVPVLDELELGWRLGRAPLVAVTGTNGKSTVCRLLAEILGAPVVGNTEFGPPLSAAPPEAGRLVCEVSSFQLQGCPAFLHDAAVLTNLAPDHLNRHADMDEYRAAKRRMFVRGDRAVALAVVDAEDGAGEAFARAVEERGGRAVRVGADVRLRRVRWSLVNARIEADSERDGPIAVRTRLPGPHNARNALLALAAARALGVPLAPALAALERCDPVPGRFQVIDAGQDFAVVVDFAHTPDAMATVLETARAVCSGRLHAVITDAGHRPESLREALGRTAATLADRVVVTEGSSGLVPTEEILAVLLRGARGAASARVELVPDRRAAFAAAFAAAVPGDTVLIVGRGHRRVLLRGADGGGVPFDDREVAREELERLGSG